MNHSMWGHTSSHHDELEVYHHHFLHWHVDFGFSDQSEDILLIDAVSVVIWKIFYLIPRDDFFPHKSAFLSAHQCDHHTPPSNAASDPLFNIIAWCWLMCYNFRPSLLLARNTLSNISTKCHYNWTQNQSLRTYFCNLFTCVTSRMPWQEWLDVEKISKLKLPFTFPIRDIID